MGAAKRRGTFEERREESPVRSARIAQAQALINQVNASPLQDGEYVWMGRSSGEPLQITDRAAYHTPEYLEAQRIVREGGRL